MDELLGTSMANRFVKQEHPKFAQIAEFARSWFVSQLRPSGVIVRGMLTRCNQNVGRIVSCDLFLSFFLSMNSQCGKIYWHMTVV